MIILTYVREGWLATANYSNTETHTNVTVQTNPFDPNGGVKGFAVTVKGVVKGSAVDDQSMYTEADESPFSSAGHFHDNFNVMSQIRDLVWSATGMSNV